MTYHLDTNSSSPSATWIPQPARMRGSRRGAKQDGARRASFKLLRRRNPKDPLTLRIRYRGGAEAWWLIEARGTHQAFPGHLCLHDVLSAVNGQGPVHMRVQGKAVES